MTILQFFFLIFLLILPGCSCGEIKNETQKSLESGKNKLINVYNKTENLISPVKNTIYNKGSLLIEQVGSATGISIENVTNLLKNHSESVKKYISEINFSLPVIDISQLNKLKNKLKDSLSQLSSSSRNVALECVLLWNKASPIVFKYIKEGEKYFLADNKEEQGTHVYKRFIRIYAGIKGVYSFYREEKKKKILDGLNILSSKKIPFNGQTFGEYSSLWVQKNFPSLKGTDFYDDPAMCMVLFLCVQDSEYIVNEMKLFVDKQGKPYTIKEIFEKELSEEQLKLLVSFTVRLKSISDGVYKFEDIEAVSELLIRIFDFFKK